MGQILEGGSVTEVAASNYTATKVVGPGYMGEFGNGLWQAFYSSGNFTVPNNVKQIRVRVVGSGGHGANQGAGGAGGGYAHGVFSVTPGSTHAVTVGNAPAGTSSFGSLISATGGTSATGVTPGIGGVGIGGDFQASGGIGGAAQGSGGGGAGSQLGNGGSTAAAGPSGGAGVNNGHVLTAGVGGGSAFGVAQPSGCGPDASGLRPTTTSNGIVNSIGATIRFPFDCFTGSGGMSGSDTTNSRGNGGPGAGSGSTYTSGITHYGGFGGGGGGAGSSAMAGRGGIGGGGGGALGTSAVPGSGGNGLVIVEW